MSVTVDHEPLPVHDLGLQTVGQVLSHVPKENRLVVQVLIDGESPDAQQMPVVRNTSLVGHTVYIETADPRRLALEVLDEVATQLSEAERLKADAADLLQKAQANKAMEQLGGCIRIWQHAQESIEKTAELLRIDLESVAVGERRLQEVLDIFAAQLKQVRAALQQRDFVALSDALLYEMETTTQDWAASIEAMRRLIRSIE
jgi:hypothetical protein